MKNRRSLIAYILALIFALGASQSPGQSVSTSHWKNRSYPSRLMAIEKGGGGSASYSSASSRSIVRDSSGNLYIGGSTSVGLNGQSQTGSQDAYISKFNSSGVLQWTAQFGGVGGSVYVAAIAIDGAANVYLVGATDVGLNGQSLIGTQDAFYAKYNSSGTHQYTKHIGATGGSVQGLGIGVDGSNNVYITGLTDQGINGQTQVGTVDTFIAKYNSSQTHQWTNQIGASGGIVNCWGLTLDTSANVFVIGDTTVGLNGQSMNGGTDQFITKYNSSGTHQWTRQNGNALGPAYAYSVTTDSSGNSYVMGQTNAGLNGQTQNGVYDSYIIKYNATGTAQWTRQFGSAGGFIEGWGITVDSSANVYVVGGTNMGFNGQSAASYSALFIVKYNSSGTHQWTKLASGISPGVTGFGVVTEGTTNIYITGTTTVDFNGAYITGTTDPFVSKYDSTGVHQWTVTNGVAQGAQSGNDVFVDSSGNIYVAGSTTKDLDGQTHSGHRSAFVTKYNSAGVLQWTRLSGAAGGVVDAKSVAVDSTGNVYIGGSTNVNLNGQSVTGQMDYFIIKYNSSGTHQWTTLAGGTGKETYISDITLDSAGNVIGIGMTSASINGQTVSGSADLFATKFSSAGAHQWTKLFGNVGFYAEGNSIARDASDNIFLFGYTNASINGQTQIGVFDCLLMKLNSAGTTQWTKQYGGAGAYCFSRGIALDTSSNIYMTGIVNTAGINGRTFAGGGDYFLMKTNSSGTLQWTKEATSTDFSPQVSAWSVAVDSNSNVFITGGTAGSLHGEPNNGSTALYISKFKTDGTRLWTKLERGSPSNTAEGLGLAVDASNNLYVVGYTNEALAGQTFQGGAIDYILMKYK